MYFVVFFQAGNTCSSGHYTGVLWEEWICAAGVSIDGHLSHPFEMTGQEEV
jgi:hypothetical protein